MDVLGAAASAGRFHEIDAMDVDPDELALLDEQTTEKVEVEFFNSFPDDFDDDDLD